MMTDNQQVNTVKFLVQEIENNGIDGLINTATKLYKNDVRSRLHYSEFYERTQRATKPLISVDEAIYYSSTFTQEHFDRFHHVLNNLGSAVMFAQKLTVIDYGCGQGLATLAFLHYLHQNNYVANKVVQVHLIEPSHITLALARQFVLAMAKHVDICVNITVHHQTLAQYLQDPIENQFDAVTLHFLSNILDICSIQMDLVQLSRCINEQQGRHHICAVSPYSRYVGFEYFWQSLSDFQIEQSNFSVSSYRFNSNKCIWLQRDAVGVSLYAQKAA